MAKRSAVEKNNKRKRIVAARGARRAALKAIIADKNVSMEERFQAVLSVCFSSIPIDQENSLAKLLSNIGCRG